MPPMESYHVSRNASPPLPRLRIIRLPATKPYRRPRPRPPPSVHHVDCSGFRQLVQMLTGQAPPPMYAPRPVRDRLVGLPLIDNAAASLGGALVRLPLIDDAAASLGGGGTVPFADFESPPSSDCWLTPWNATNNSGTTEEFAAAVGAPSTVMAAWSTTGTTFP